MTELCLSYQRSYLQDCICVWPNQTHVTTNRIARRKANPCHKQIGSSIQGARRLTYHAPNCTFFFTFVGGSHDITASPNIHTDFLHVVFLSEILFLIIFPFLLLARSSETVSRQPRFVSIFSIQWVLSQHFSRATLYPWKTWFGVEKYVIFAREKRNRRWFIWAIELLPFRTQKCTDTKEINHVTDNIPRTRSIHHHKISKKNMKNKEDIKNIVPTHINNK